MKVKSSATERTLEFQFSADDMDAVMSIDRVWFKFDRNTSVEPLRLSAIAYLLCMDAIGNVFFMEDPAIPAHLAAAIASEFCGHEMFVGGVSNVAAKVVGSERYRALSCGVSAGDPPITGQADRLWLVRTVCGYLVRDGRGDTVLSVSTNLDLFASLQSTQPKAVAAAVLFFIVFDALGVSVIDFPPDGLAGGRVATVVKRCIREAGGAISINEQEGAVA
jgi:hypothetical protein